MAARPNPHQLVAVDSNVAYDLNDAREFAVDAIELIRRRLNPVDIVAPLAVQQELGYIARFADSEREREAARQATRALARHRIGPQNLQPVQLGIAGRVAERLLAAGLLPVTEENDAHIFVEAAVGGCTMLITSDGHLRHADFARLTFELNNFDLNAPVIATPREILRKFFR